MTKKELIYQIAKEGKVSVTETEAFYDIFEKVLLKAITNQAEVILSPRLGRFMLKTKKPQIRPEMIFEINKKTGKRRGVPTGNIVEYPASTVVHFKISSSLKQAVKPIELTTEEKK